MSSAIALESSGWSRLAGGTQEGRPIDRVMSAVAAALGLQRQVLVPDPSSGRAYFITRLLRDVIFQEAGLAGKTTVVGTSLVSLTGNLLKSGAVDTINFWDPKLAGKVIAEIAERLLDGKTVKTGDDLGVEGYRSVVVKGDVIYGSAWVDVTKDNMDKYNF